VNLVITHQAMKIAKAECSDGIAATWLPIAETFCCAVSLLLAEAVRSNQPRPVIRATLSVT